MVFPPSPSSHIFFHTFSLSSTTKFPPFVWPMYELNWNWMCCVCVYKFCSDPCECTQWGEYGECEKECCDGIKSRQCATVVSEMFCPASDKSSLKDDATCPDCQPIVSATVVQPVELFLGLGTKTTTFTINTPIVCCHLPPSPLAPHSSFQSHIVQFWYDCSVSPHGVSFFPPFSNLNQENSNVTFRLMQLHKSK